MLVASELKGELARIYPARSCCRRAELAGLLFVRSSSGGVSTLEHSTARVAVQLATSLGIPASAHAAGPMRSGGGRGHGARHHLAIALDVDGNGRWQWAGAKPCDRRAFLRGVLLSGSISLTRSGPHVEFVFDDAARASELAVLLREMEMTPGTQTRRGRSVVYLKGREQLGTLLRLAGANRALLDLESDRVARDVRNRLNRLLNAEEANLGRTVRAADRQLQAIAQLQAGGELERLPEALRETAEQRRRQPDADLDSLAASLGVSRSAVNHRLRRIVALAGGGRDRNANHIDPGGPRDSIPPTARGRQLEDESHQPGRGGRPRARRGRPRPMACRSAPWSARPAIFLPAVGRGGGRPADRRGGADDARRGVRCLHRRDLAR